MRFVSMGSSLHVLSMRSRTSLPGLPSSKPLPNAAHDAPVGHCGAMRKHGYSFIRLANSPTPCFSWALLSLPRSPAPWRKMTSGYFLPSSTVAGFSSR